MTGVTLERFRYPLHEATLEFGQSIAISNLLIAETGMDSYTERSAPRDSK
ncbi:hypothetical protein [Paenibacillus gyeongsangnamensis]